MKILFCLLALMFCAGCSSHNNGGDAQDANGLEEGGYGGGGSAGF